MKILFTGDINFRGKEKQLLTSQKKYWQKFCHLQKMWSEGYESNNI